MVSGCYTAVDCITRLLSMGFPKQGTGWVPARRSLLPLESIDTVSCVTMVGNSEDLILEGTKGNAGASRMERERDLG